MLYIILMHPIPRVWWIDLVNTACVEHNKDILCWLFCEFLSFKYGSNIVGLYYSIWQFWYFSTVLYICN